MHSQSAFVIAAYCIATGILSVMSALAQDEVFVAQDGLNTGNIGAYDVSFGPGTASSSTVNAGLITSPPAGASTQVYMSLATDGMGDLFVGEWANGGMASVGEYSLNGSVINSSLLTLSDSSGTPELAADSEGQIFIGIRNTVSEYTTGGTLLNSFHVGSIASVADISALAVDGSGNVYAAYETGLQGVGYPYNTTIEEYTASGSALGRPITTPNYVNALAVGGGDIFVSIRDGPPDLENRVDEYTTGGGLLMSGLISGTSGNLALDGQGHLFVDSYGDGTVGVYTTSGDLLNSTVISGAGWPEDMVVIPIPEPAAPRLLAIGAVGLLVCACLRRRTGLAKQQYS
jgi:hypothetical protein